MPKTDLDDLEARDTQSRASKSATFDLLKSKKRAERSLAIKLPVDGGDEEVIIRFRAIGQVDYDRLLTRNGPTSEQRLDNLQYNIHTFAPALLAATVFEPDMSNAQWTEVWNDPNWGRGELMQLFGTAMDICHSGLDVRPTEAG